MNQHLHLSRKIGGQSALHYRHVFRYPSALHSQR